MPARVHGLSRTPLYRIWNNARQRCGNPRNTQFKYYGARGITLCESWSDFEAFQQWALKTGYAPALTLERLDNDGPYAPENCTWASRSEQARNRRNTPSHEAFGVSKPLVAWAEDPRCVVGYATLLNRVITWKWVLEKALTTPPRQRRGQ